MSVSSIQMGLDILAYAYSIDTFCAVYGCRDEALFDKIMKSSNRSTCHYLDIDPIKAYPSERSNALQGIINGDMSALEPATYAWALVGYVCEMGRFLGSNDGSYGRQVEADNFLRKIGESTSALPEFNVKWPIGEVCVTDWPMYYGVRAVDVVRYAKTMQGVMTRVTSKRRAHLRDSAYSFLQDLTEYYTECAALGTDLILIAH